MPTSPVVRVSLPRAERPRIVPLTVEQVEALTAAMPSRNRAMVTTQVGLGLRVGELLALTIDDVDWLKREVHVRHQLDPGARTRTQPKTPRSRRVLPLPTVVAEALAAHVAAFPPTSDGTLFYTRTSQPYRSDYFGLIFSRASRLGRSPGRYHEPRPAPRVCLLVARGRGVGCSRG